MVIGGDALKVATDNFSNAIGHGGFGVVYRGSYHHVDVAVKVLNKVVSRVLLLYTFTYYVVLNYRKGLRA